MHESLDQQRMVTKQFSFSDNLAQLQSNGSLKRNKALEDLMRQLVTLDIGLVSEEVRNPKSKLSEIVALICERFQRREDHSSMKALFIATSEVP